MSADVSLAAACGGARLDPELRSELTGVCAEIAVDFGGGSSVLKALVLADLVVGHDLAEVVEIGVWRGRSLLPMAVLLERLDRGHAVGIDPYAVGPALQTDDRPIAAELARWAREVDWEAIVGEVRGVIGRRGLEHRCELVRSTSRGAADRFPDAGIDLLHVDGNHDRAAVELDLALYLPKVRPGGFVALDDVSWSSVRPAYDQLRSRSELVFEIFHGPEIDLGEGLPNDFAVFRV
jgi:hypothetical protein